MIEELENRINKLDGFYESLKNRQTDLNNEIDNLKGQVSLLTKTSTVLKHLVDIMIKDEISKMAGLITYGLKTIFYDQDLKFSPVITKKNDKVHIELKTRNKNIEGEFGSFGGSVAVIESFLLRILCLLKMNLAKLILLDETFASVGSEYIPNTSQLISELSKKLGLDILLVTHQREFQQYANRVYRVKDSANGLVIEKLK